MEKISAQRKKLTAIIVLLTLILISIYVAFLMLVYGKGWFQSNKIYFLRLDEGYHLGKDSPVFMLDVEIGKVDEIKIKIVEGLPLVEIRIKVMAQYANFIRQDSKAAIVRPILRS